MVEQATGNPWERPAPFPGMDPFLEEPGGWSGVHDGLIVIIRLMLNQVLGPSFVADAGTTVYVVAPDERRWVFPDVYLLETARPGRTQRGGRIAAPIQVTLEPPATIRQPYVMIRDRASRAVVTIVEIISPVNKTPARAETRQDFLRKRRDVMASTTHWVEIDLLRAGERPPEIAGAGDYYVLVKRAAETVADLWPIGLRERLPAIGVPLRDDVPDASLDLQVALDRLYLQGRYSDLIDYDRAPPPPSLSRSDQHWVTDRLAAWRGGAAATS
jgi:hypothetical protein